MGRFLWSLKMRLACFTASRIITVSDAAKQEIVEYIGIKGDRIDVICEGADPRFIPVAPGERRVAARRRAGIPHHGRLLLFVGGIAPHKNLLKLLAGFAEVAELVPDLRLAIVGDPNGDGFHSNYQEVATQVGNDPRLKGRVHFAGFVSDEDLAALYSEALSIGSTVLLGRLRPSRLGGPCLRDASAGQQGRSRRRGRRSGGSDVQPRKVERNGAADLRARQQSGDRGQIAAKRSRTRAVL